VDEARAVVLVEPAQEEGGVGRARRAAEPAPLRLQRAARQIVTPLVAGRVGQRRQVVRARGAQRARQVVFGLLDDRGEVAGRQRRRPGGGP